MGLKRKPKVSPDLIRGMFGDSLVAGWWMDQESGASTVPDFSGNGHDGTPTSVTFEERPLSDGLTGTAGLLSGTSTEIAVIGSATSFDYLLAGNFWVGAWITRENPPVSSSRLFDTLDQASGAGTSCYLNSSGTLVYITREPDQTQYVYSIVGPELNDGPHFVEVWGDGTDVFYALDGTVIGSDALEWTSGSANGVDLNLFNNNAGDRAWNGVAHGIAFVDRPATERERQALVDLSGVYDLKAPYDPYYVSQSPDSRKRYYAEYLNDYLTHIGKPATLVLPKRRYGEATARDITGAHDGVLGSGDVSLTSAPLTDDDGRTLESGGSVGDHIAVGHHSDLDITDSATVLVVSEYWEGGRAFAKFDNSSDLGWRIYTTSGGNPVFLIGDGTSTVFETGNQTDFSTGGPTLMAGLVDGAAETIGFFHNRVFRGTEDISALGSVANTEDVSILAESASAGPRLGRQGATAFIPHVLTGAELLHLDDTAFDRTKRARLDLDLPDYLSSYSGNIEFWTDHSRFKRFSDTDQIEHLTSFIEGDYAVQTDPAKRPTYGADAIEFGGSAWLNCRNFTDDPTALTWAFVFDLTSVTSSGFDVLTAHRLSASDARIDVYFSRSANTLNFQVKDSASNGGTVNLGGIQRDTKTILVGRFDKSTGDRKLSVIQQGDVEKTTSATDTYTGNFASSRRRFCAADDPANFVMEGKIYEALQLDVNLTDIQTDDLIDALKTKWGI